MSEQGDITRFEDEGGAPEHTVVLELSYHDAVHLMNRADLKYTRRDKRIMDAFRLAFQDGHHTPRHG